MKFIIFIMKSIISIIRVAKQKLDPIDMTCQLVKGRVSHEPNMH